MMISIILITVLSTVFLIWYYKHKKKTYKKYMKENEYLYYNDLLYCKKDVYRNRPIGIEIVFNKYSEK